MRKQKRIKGSIWAMAQEVGGCDTDRGEIWREHVCARAVSELSSSGQSSVRCLLHMREERLTRTVVFRREVWETGIWDSRRCTDSIWSQKIEVRSLEEGTTLKTKRPTN